MVAQAEQKAERRIKRQLEKTDIIFISTGT